MPKFVPLYQRYGAALSTETTPRLRRKSAPRPLPVHAFRKIHAYLVKHGDLTGLIALLLGYHAGLRTVEISRLTLSDIGLDTRTIKVSSRKGRNRVVPMNEVVAEAVQSWLTARPGGCGHDFLFCSSLGSPLTSSRIAHRLACAARSVGVLDWKSHRLRHTFATRLYDAGVNPLFIMKQGG